MKTAGEVAEEILKRHYYGQTYWKQLTQDIAQALTVFASEAAAGMQSTMTKMAHEWVDKARAKALEEAALKIPCFQPGVEKCECPGHTFQKAIRALKGGGNLPPAFEGKE